MTKLRRATASRRHSILGRDPVTSITLAGLFELAHACYSGVWKEPELASGPWLAPNIRRLLVAVLRQLSGTGDLFHEGQLIVSKTGLRIEYMPDGKALAANELAQRAEHLFVRGASLPFLPKKLMEAHA